jgi:hypothetical protein
MERRPCGRAEVSDERREEMKLEEHVRREVAGMEVADISRILDLIELLKSARRSQETAPLRNETTEPPYMLARAALRPCKDSLSDDVIEGRQERF